MKLTSVSAHATRRSGRGEQDDNITEELDVCLEGFALLRRELLLGRIELEPV
jgi:hypothetical protein